MNGKTHKIRRRLSIVALAASIAAVAIPAASAGGKYFGPGSNRVEKHGPYGADWVKVRSDDVSSQVFRNAGQEHGSNGFLGQTTNQGQVNVMFPRADDKLFRAIVKEAAQEHGAAGFGNGLDLSIGLITPGHVTVVRDAGDAQRDVSAS